MSSGDEKKSATHAMQPAAFKKTNTVMKLPVELLCIILDMSDPRPAYREWKKYIVHLEAENDEYGTCRTPEREPPPAPTHYPHHLARVCQRWNDILAGLPSRWANPIVFLDHDLEETLADLKMSFRFSQDLPLDLVVDYTMKTEKAEVDAYCDIEPSRSRAVIKVLSPHFQRCRNITFETMLGMSLPSPSKDLSGVSSTLRSLTLRCKYDFHHPTDILFGADPAPIPDRADCKLTNLNELYLSGYTIIDACRNAPHLIQAAQSTLTLRDFIASDEETAEQIVPYFLKALSRERRRRGEIALYNIDLPLWEPDALLDEPFYIQNRTTLTDLRYKTMCNILDFVDFQHAGDLTIKRCPLPEEASRIGAVHYLHLNEITNCEANLADMLLEWDGLHLSITQGDPLDDLLRMLASRRRRGDCYMDELELDCCGMFTIDAMKTLCESRTPSDMSLMYSIEVTGIGPVILKEERQ
ncbi:unnamed protein product [Cyclocybe aegerita]|uniref:F-box domain-containing protein n=1 Tax=Cyclocybe aegerita TaxID=1973307 RepID=A0A8S0WS52_CYCAE|nr:unnamed protein product [Cyclocybe aegerita]